MYKPPNIPFTQLSQYPHPAIYAGDFNCQHTLWDYRNDTTDGTMLNDWTSNLDLTLLYDNRQPNSFCSGRWQTQTYPDLAFTTTNSKHRTVTDLFPRCQHRPSIITHDALIKPSPSAPILRWNFRKAHWDDFTKDTCKLLLELPDPNTPDIDDAYCPFISTIIKTAKLHIPRGHRKIYIPGWDNECDDLAEKHHAATTEQEKHDTATALMEHLDSARQERWVETVQAIDFTHSSRKDWSVVRRLTGEKNNKPQVPIKANKIAQHVVKNGRNATVTVNREFTREVNKELKEELQGASEDFDLCSDFTVDVMQQALRSLKSGKAPGPDSIHPGCLMHLGTECQNWLRMSMTNCMQRTKIPKSWRRAKIIAILKPGKSPEEAGSYRPINLYTVGLLQTPRTTNLQPSTSCCRSTAAT